MVTGMTTVNCSHFNDTVDLIYFEKILFFAVHFCQYFALVIVSSSVVIYLLLIVQDDKQAVMRKSAFCYCKNKGADQLRGNPAADQHIVFAL